MPIHWWRRVPHGGQAVLRTIALWRRRAAERRRLLSLLAKARRSAARLPALTAVLPKGFFEDIERRIRAEVDGRHSIKLPVAVFLLVRRPAEDLTRLDAILNRLQARQRRRAAAAPVLRWPVPAHCDRPRAGGRTEARRLRRASRIT